MPATHRGDALSVRTLRSEFIGNPPNMMCGLSRGNLLAPVAEKPRVGLRPAMLRAGREGWGSPLDLSAGATLTSPAA